MSGNLIKSTNGSVTPASVIDDSRICKKIGHTSGGTVYGYHLVGSGTVAPSLTDGKWKLILTDDAGSLAYPEVNGLPDTGYNHDFTGADVLTFFEPA